MRLTIEYDGKNYAGWQAQKSYHVTTSPRHRYKTIQETIEKTLQKILQEKVRLIASGRTDAGVCAIAQVANFKTNSKISLEKLQKALNGLLPEDIAITKIEEVPLDFHSRFAAKSKTYRYTILNSPNRSPLLRDKVYFYPYSLNMQLMRQEAKCLLGRHDFRAFCASGSSTKDIVRTIKRITIKRAYRLPIADYRLPDVSLLIVDIEADGFLYNMARIIVGTLIEIGRGKFPPGSLKKILLARNRRLAGPTVPPRGLCLLKVKY